MIKRLCLLLCALLLAAQAASAEIPAVFPSAGVPYTNEMTIAFDAGGITTLDFPVDWNMLGDSLHLPDAEPLYTDGFQNMRYHTEDRGYGLVMRNQMIAFQHGSAGVIALEVDRIEGEIERLELEIGGFTRLSLETMPEEERILYMFYGIGGARVTLAAYVIAGGEQHTPEKVLLETDAEVPQEAAFSFPGGEVRLSASFLEMDVFLEQMPVSRPVPTGMEADPMLLIEPGRPVRPSRGG